MTSADDRIEKEIFLRAPLQKVWSALTDHREFGRWFGVLLESAFRPGETVRGQLTIRGYEHLRLEMFIERIESPSRFSYRWHPYAVDPKRDYSNEPPTLVEFELREVDGGVRLNVVESGFSRLPAERRAEAFRMNESGWAAQLANIERHVSPK